MHSSKRVTVALAAVASASLLTAVQLSTQRALELRRDEQGVLQLQGRLRLLPGPVQDVLKVCASGFFKSAALLLFVHNDAAPCEVL